MCRFYLREYSRTLDGALNILEVVLGSLLWALYRILGATTWSEEFLFNAACAIVSNGCVFLVSSSFSIPTALMMPKMFYYSVFHLVAASCYILGGTGSLRNDSLVDGITATICGAIHAGHFVYSMRGSPLKPPPP